MINQNFTLSVTKFNNIVRDIFNNEELLHNIKIVGEVFGVSKSKTAIYFSIKDEESSLPCVSFYADMLDDINEGDSVIVTGSPNFYAKSGRFNFVVNKIEPYGLGILYQKFLLLKQQLENEGLFDITHKKPIPQNIKRIGVVTSKEGAVLQDIKNVCWRRNANVDIVLYDSKVQGIGAEKEIASGINFFSNYNNVDVVIVARGGGSLEDLSAYNTEVVARATYNCNKPIVSAVGHEVDFTIIDFVADLRAPTPSAAAELLTKDASQSKQIFNQELFRLSRLLENFIVEKNFTLSTYKQKLIANMQNTLIEHKNKLYKLINILSTKLNSFILQEDYNLKLKLASLKKLNPLDIIALGYAKIEQNGKVVASASELELNKTFEVNFVDAIISAKAIDKKETK